MSSDSGVRRVDEVDSRVLDVSWSPGTVHLRVDGEEVLRMSPEVAARIAVLTNTCVEAILEDDPSVETGGWVRELLGAARRRRLAEAEEVVSAAEKDESAV